jgi:hypothetical protein
MRALTLTQPWAGLVASGIKLVENRPRRMIKREDFGRPSAIHASRQIDESIYKRIVEIAPELIPYGQTRAPWARLSRVTSAVIAVATLDRWVADHITSGLQSPGSLTREEARFYSGPIGYVLRDVRALAAPVPCKGMRGFWALPADVERQVIEQIARAA